MIWRESEKLKDVRVRRLQSLVQPPVDGKGGIAWGVPGNRPSARGQTGSPGRSDRAGGGKQDWPADAGIRQVKRGAFAGHDHARGISEIGGEAERAVLVEAVHDRNAEVVVHDAVAATDRELVFLSQNF